MARELCGDQKPERLLFIPYIFITRLFLQHCLHLLRPQQRELFGLVEKNAKIHIRAIDTHSEPTVGDVREDR